MLNNNLLRWKSHRERRMERLCTCAICQAERDAKYGFSAKVVLSCMVLAVLLVFCVGKVHAAQIIKDEDAINAIIGEAEGEPYEGKLAVAKTIINRGHLKGVYGGKSQRVLQHKYSNETYKEAKKAWEYAKNTPMGYWEATGWGNEGDIAQFKREGWLKDCVITAKISNHYFYKEIKK